MSRFVRPRWLHGLAKALVGSLLTSRKRQQVHLRPLLERLEDRWVPDAVPPGNYSGLFTTNKEFLDTSAPYVINGPLTVANGATLTVGTNVKVLIRSGQTLTVEGALNITDADTITVEDPNAGGSAGIFVSGVMTVTDTDFVRSPIDGFHFTFLQVNSGGRLTASNSRFDWDQLTFSPGALIGATDLTNNRFDLSIVVTAQQVSRLSNNRRFEDINLNAGSLAAGETVALNQIGTESTVNLRYVFPSPFTVNANATLTVGTNVKVLIRSGQTLTIDGNLTITDADTITIEDPNASGTAGIFVSGVMTVTDTDFVRSPADGFHFTLLQVNPGGRLTASNSRFDWDQLSLSPGALVSNTDLTNNRFDLPIFVTAQMVPRLTNNRRFEDINLNAGNLAAGETVALNQIGTESTFNLRYVFPNLFTVQTGATLTVGTNVKVLIRSSQVLTVDGTLTITDADTITVEDPNASGTAGIFVSGVMTVTDTDFVRSPADGFHFTLLQVNPGGRLTASNSRFDWDQLTLSPGALIGATDLTNNRFDLPIFVTAQMVPRLTNNKRFEDINLNAGNLAAGESVAFNPIGSESTANLRYVFTGAFTVQSGATLTVGTNVKVFIRAAQLLTIDGTLTITDADTITVEDANASGTSGILVSGVMTVTDTDFVRSPVDGFQFTLLQVNPGGRLTASNSRFDWDQLTFSPGALVSNTDLSNNRFDLPIFVTAQMVPRLTNNKRFEDINLSAGSLAAGDNVAFNQIGSESTANLRYVFPNSFTVSTNATLTIGTNVKVLIGASQALTIDGTLTITDADTITIQDPNASGTAGIFVSGVMSVTDTDFVRSPADGFHFTILQVNPGGHFSASNSRFDWDQLTLSSGAILGATDLVNNRFDLPLVVTAQMVPRLSNNRRFEDINLSAGNLASGETLVLSQIGTESTANLRYAFAGLFTLQSGATLTVGNSINVSLRASLTVQSGAMMTVGTNANVIIGAAQTLTVDGTLTITDADTITIEDPNASGTAGILVSGVMTVTDTDFVRSPADGFHFTLLQVNPGGRLTASNSRFDWDQLTLSPGALIGATDLTNNRFDLPIFVTAQMVPRLTNNKRFEDINLNAGSLAAGDNVAFNQIGTESTANLRYVFPNSFTVSTNATLTVGTNVKVLIGASQALTIDGTLTITDADTITIQDPNASGTAGIFVNGSMTVTDTDFARSPLGGFHFTLLQVNSGGHFSASNSRFDWDQLTINSGSAATLRFVKWFAPLALNSGAAVSITRSDFSSAAATVTATGDANAIFDLTGNYWGTTVPANIEAKITHKVDNANRPTVLFDPFLNVPPPAPVTIAGLAFDDRNGNGLRDGTEPGSGGVAVFLDLDNDGVFDVGEPNQVTQADNPATTTINERGQFRFDGLEPGTYVVRELVPAAATQTAPAAAAVMTTVLFDGTGAEADITGPGVTAFTVQGASFSGGSIFAAPQTALRASGALSWNASGGNAAIDFNRLIGSVSFFYVHGSGFAAGTATAFGVDGSVLGTVSSRAATTEGDPANFVTLSFAQPIARITFTNGILDNFTFTTAANNRAWLVRLTSGQSTSSVFFGNQNPPGSFFSDGVEPTSTGFRVTFPTPLDVSALNLYDGAAGTLGAADATLVGQTVGAVTGSLVVSADHRTVTFIKTSGLLAADTYTVTLRSGVNAFKDAAGNPLDGNGDGIPGDDLVAVFNIQPLPTNAVVVSIPSFARGFGQPVNVPASGTQGLPIILSTGVNVSGVDLTLHYDPALLTLSGFTAAIPGAAALFNVTSPGTAVLSVSSASQFSSTTGSVILGNLLATVPTMAPYAAKEVLSFSDLAVFDNNPGVPLPLPAVGVDALHVAAFLGDTNGDRAYTVQDVTLEQRIIGQVDRGFTAYQLADPLLLGDITRNGQIQANDTTSLQRVIGQLAVPTIPPLPAGIPAPPAGGPDPQIFIPNLTAQPGRTVTVPVRLTVTEAAGITVSGFQVALAYDASRFTVGATATLGTLFAGFSGFLSFPAPGTLIFNASAANGTGLIAFDTTTDLFTLSFQVMANAPEGPTTLNILQNFQTTSTALFANDAELTELTLVPAPTNGATDAVDGVFTISSAKLPTEVAGTSTTIGYRTTEQFVTLNATVTSTDGIVNEGTVTFTVATSTGTVIDVPATGTIVNGTASVNYRIPATTAAGTYKIQVSYSGTDTFNGDSDETAVLTINPAVATVQAADATTTYSVGAHTQLLTATVISPAGIANEGMVTFTLFKGGVPIGTAAPGNVVNGSASVNYVIPAGTAADVYTIQATYSGTSNFNSPTENGHTLTIQTATTTIAASTATAIFSLMDQVVTLNAVVNSLAGVVNEGTVTFTLLNSGLPLGTEKTVNVVNGSASANYTMPGGTPLGSYTIQAVYHGANNFKDSTDTAQSLTVVPASAHLVFTQQPVATVVGMVLPAITVSLQDALGNVIDDDTTSITVSLGTGPAGAHLRGTSTRIAVNGVAHFDDLSVDTRGTFTLTAIAGDLTAVSSTSFAIVAPVFNVWDGGGADDKWTTAANWANDVAPIPGEDLLYPQGAARMTSRNDFPAGTAFGTIRFFGTGYDIQGNRLQLNTVIDETIGAGNILRPDLTLPGTLTITVRQADGTLRLTGNLNGAGGLTKTGAGTLVLEGTNSYAGNTQVSAGVLRLGVAAAVPGSTSSWMVEENSTLDLNGFSVSLGSLEGKGQVLLGSVGATLTVGGNGRSTQFDGVISGMGNLTKLGAGTFTLAGMNTYVGVTSVLEGTLRFGAANVLADPGAVFVAANATLDLNGFGDIISDLSGPGNLALGNGTLTIGGAATTTFAGLISGTGGLIKTGTGTLTLSNPNNSFSGSVRIEQGTLVLGVAGAFGVGTAADKVVVTATGTLALAAGVETGYPLQIAGTLRSAGTNRLTGPIDWQNGQVLVEGTELTVQGTLSGTGGFTKRGTGQLVLASTNSTYQGTTQITEGTLLVTAAGALGTSGGGTVVAAAGTLAFQGGINYVSPEPVLLAGGTLVNLSGGNRFSGPITQSAPSTLTSKADSLILNGSIDNGGFLLTADSGNILVNNVVRGSGGLLKRGTGDFVLRQQAEYTGPTTVLEGSLRIRGLSAQNVVTVHPGAQLAGVGQVGTLTILGGQVAPGESPGILDVIQDFRFDPDSRFMLDIDAYVSPELLQSGQGYDQIHVATGRVVLTGGSLTVRLGNFTAQQGQQFVIVRKDSAGPIEGRFANLDEGSVVQSEEGQLLQISYVGGDGNDVVLIAGIRTTVALSSSANPLPPGQALVLTVVATGATGFPPAGEVRLEVDATVIGRAGLDNTGRTTFRPVLAPGTHAVQVVYEGNPVFVTAASAVLTQTIQATPPDNPTTHPGRLQLLASSFLIDENQGSLHIKITRSDGSDGTVAVTVTTSDGTAVAGLDYSPIAGPVTFGPGETEKEVVISINNDRLVEEDQEDFTLVLTNPAGGATLGEPHGAVVGIREDDLPRVPDGPPPANLSVAAIVFSKSTEHYRDFVTKAYARFLSRQPDEAGLNYWVVSMRDGGLTQERLEAGFLVSQEYIGRFGGLGQSWIEGIYKDLLDRPGETAGVAFWTNLLRGGTSPQDIAFGFTGSLERQSNRVQETYRRLLSREAEPAGLAYWVAFYKQGGTNEDIEAGFVGSPEYYANPTKGANNVAKWVRRAYADVLFRQAAVEEMNFWMSALR